jgi:hypothetical protein
MGALLSLIEAVPPVSDFKTRRDRSHRYREMILILHQNLAGSHTGKSTSLSNGEKNSVLDFCVILVRETRTWSAPLPASSIITIGRKSRT